MRGWRTVTFSALIAAFGFLQAFDFTTIISNPKVVGYVLMTIGIVVSILRALTTSPIGKEE